MKNKIDIKCITICGYIMVGIVCICCAISCALLIKTSVDLKASGYEWAWTLKGIQNYFCAMKSYSWIYTITLTLLPIVLTVFTIIENVHTKEVSSLLDIRNALNQKDNVEVHENLRSNNGKWKNSGISDNNESWRKIDNYLGTIELCAILLQKGIITFEHFDRQFGYRVDNFISQKQIVQKIEGEKDSWQDLLYLINKKEKWINMYKQNIQ